MSRFSNWTLTTSTAVARVVVQPFRSADTIQEYSNRGYWILAIIISIATMALQAAGAKSSLTIMDLPPWVLFVLNLVFKGEAGHIDTKLPLIYLIPLLYSLFGTITPLRHRVGEFFADFLFRLFESLVVFGEWCIANRQASLLMIVILIVFLTSGLTYQVRVYSRAKQVQRDFINWLDTAERFLDKSTLTHAEPTEYETLELYWRSYFKDYLMPIEGHAHPGIVLHDIIDSLFVSTSWPDFYLNSKRAQLDRLYSTVEPIAEKITAAQDQRAWGILNLLLARIEHRLAGDACDSPDALSKALGYLERVKGERFRSGSENLRGNVYKCISVILMKTHRNASSRGVSVPVSDSLGAHCDGPLQCAHAAYQAYEMSAIGFPPCSMQQRRRLNNQADLLVKMALHYSELSKVPVGPPFDRWLVTPQALASTLETQARGLFQCLRSDSFRPLVFVTAAQAYGAAAMLNERAGRNAEEQLFSAGQTLRLATAFFPGNLSSWDLSCFCSALRQDPGARSFEPNFLSGLRSLASSPLKQEDELSILRNISAHCNES